MRQGRHLNLHVDPIQQRAGNLVLIAQDTVRRAAALLDRMPEIAARAGIHGGDQLKLRGEVGLAGGPRNRDAAALQRFPQYFQHAAVELRQFVEEQDTAMGQRNFSGTGRAAAANCKNPN